MPDCHVRIQCDQYGRRRRRIREEYPEVVLRHGFNGRMGGGNPAGTPDERQH
jgi:hypothetical protein